jgi:DNA-binding NtrC family response regulator
VNHEFPGNVRELQNRIQRAVLVEQSDTVTAGDLGLPAAPGGRGELHRRATPSGPLGTLASGAGGVMPMSSSGGGGGAGSGPVRAAASDPASEEERAGIQEALVRAGGVVAKAAAEMGLSRQALYRRMERLGIVMERRPR